MIFGKKGYKAFYIAIGCQGGRIGRRTRERMPGLITALWTSFERSTRGNPMTIKGDVVVVGGGNVAIDCSRDAVRVGAGKVYQYSLETRDIMPASAEEIEEALEDGVILERRLGTEGDPEGRPRYGEAASYSRNVSA